MDTSKLEAKLKEMIKTEAAEGNKKKPVKFDEKIESLIDIALEDGMLTDKERELLLFFQMVEITIYQQNYMTKDLSKDKPLLFYIGNN